MTGTASTPPAAEWHADARALPAWAPGARGMHAHGRLRGLDGLRALAILGVVLYHGDLAWFPGGYLGVDLFFVLSGFLVTALLLEERIWCGTIDLAGFYARRLRRLFPALAAMLGVLWVVVPWCAPDAQLRLLSDIPAALFYVANWWFIQNEGSYFDFIGRPPLLQHLWSLAIEEQFYLLWPLLLASGLAVTRSRTALFATGVAAAATGWMAVLAMRNGLPMEDDPSRLYFGSDTHCMGLFVGAALAGVVRPWGWRLQHPGYGLFVAREGLGLLGLAGILAAFAFAAEHGPWLYRGGFLIFALCGLALLQAVLMAHSWLGRIFEWSPLRWIGRRSYALYLWHWPVFMLTRPDLDTPLSGASNLVLRLVLVALLAELSHRLIEAPAMRLGQRTRAARGGGFVFPRRMLLGGLLLGAPAVGALVLSSTADSTVSRPLAHVPQDVAEAMGLIEGGPTRVVIEKRVEAVRKVSLQWPNVPPAMRALQSRSTSARARAAVPAPESSGRPVAAHPVQVPARSEMFSSRTILGTGLTAVGDSVLLGARVRLQQALPAAQTDAEIGRQAAALLARLRDLRARALLAPTVLIHLGTNGHVTEAQLREALESLRDRQRVILVNARAPRRWVDANNALMARVAPDYPNVVLTDWAALGDAHPEFFASDGIHLSPTGQRAFVETILRVVTTASVTRAPTSAIPQAASQTDLPGRRPS